MQKFLNRFIIAVQLSGLVCVCRPAIASSSTADSTRHLGPETIFLPYSKTGTILYNQKTKTFGIDEDSKPVLENCFSRVKIDGKYITSKQYQHITTHKTVATDAFGKSVKDEFTLTGKNLPTMVQVFNSYLSGGKSFFTIEVYIKGKNLKTNYIEPVAGDMKKFNGDTRSLFVPFDNDTFISYDSKAFKAPLTNTSAEVGVVFDNDSRNGVVFGSVEHETWKTGVRTIAKKDSADTFEVWGGYTEEAVNRDKIAHGEISGDVIKSPKIFVGRFDDWRTGLEEFGKANRIAEPPYIFNWTKPTPIGWNSWGVMQEKLSYDKAIKVADFFADSIPAFRNGNTAFIDLDSFWDNMIKGGWEGDFGQLKAFADYCKSKGLQPGVYWAPFTDWGWKGGPDRKVLGSNYTYGETWTKVGDGYHDIDGARATDPTHPGTLQHIDYVIGKLKACGFKMIKIDFLGHAAAESSHFYDPKITTGMQAYKKGMEHLIDELDGQMLVYAAISPSLATGRYAHMRRIACDAFKTIKDTRYTLNSVNYGWWQTYLYNYIDADHVVLNTESEGANRARMLSAVVTGTFITGDDFSTHGQWSDRAKAMYQNPEILKIVANGKAFRPVEGNTGTETTEQFVTKIGNTTYLALFNYGTEAKTFTIDAKRTGLDPAKRYKGSSLLQRSGKSYDSFVVAAGDADLYKLEEGR
ncbi:alpha-galactosidase [Mucilaginibacter celer]|uniref:Alpha-galactosidase n=1 Tax=Mucilaginibacter celer TaxID=2305508 RepID=A0A494VZ88_9SPHI|nr:alpha-galactosidase [Mucilaginibacter celer]AYL96455.1 alpha-galactosidase [Mucilaginibacter celer]